MMKRVLLTATLLLALMTGCKKDDPVPYPLNKLPHATQSGENTFGCIINGEPWVAYAPFNPIGGKLRATYDEEYYGADYNRRLWLASYRIITSYDWNKDSLASSFGFDIRPILGIGSYEKNNLETYKISHTIVSPGPTRIYELDSLSPFHIQITKLDTVKKIVSGTFEMDLRRTIDSNEILQIRHGRFDARYEPR